MKLFSVDDIKSLTRQILAEKGISMLDFIEKAGRDIADTIVGATDRATPVVIFAGNNVCGAYALAAGRMLFEAGFSPYTFFFNFGGANLSPECDACRRRYIACSAEQILTEIHDMNFSMPELDSGMLIVDGLAGSDIAAPISRSYQILVTAINDSGARIVSIDTPSGLPGDPVTGLVNSKIVHADLTLTPTMPKQSFFINENIELVGRWRVVGYRPSPGAISRTASMQFLIEEHDIASRLHPREADSSKNDYGNAIIFAGSYGMMGAAVLATIAAVRSGCGKVTCHSPRCGFTILQSVVPSALFEADPNEEHISLIETRRYFSAIAIGPGLGTDDDTINALEAFLKTASANKHRVILDADALNCIAIRPSMLDLLPLLSIITPHASEFDRIFGAQPSSTARLAKAIEVSRHYKIIIVLKGHYTATVRPDGKVFFNSSGTAALATAGTGDVLTGLMAGLLAQGMKPEIASISAAYIHGLAGQMAQEVHGSYGITAEDVAHNIGRVIKKITHE